MDLYKAPSQDDVKKIAKGNSFFGFNFTPLAKDKFSNRDSLNPAKSFEDTFNFSARDSKRRPFTTKAHSKSNAFDFFVN